MRRNYSGRDNPNCKYPTLNDYFFSQIDTEEKAYILGLIASDGCVRKNTITIALDYKDKDLLEKVRNIICPELPLRNKKNTNLVYLCINSSIMSESIRNWLNIPLNKSKHSCVDFPKLSSNKLTYDFIRGFFDGDGSIRNIERQSLDCKITTNSEPFKINLSKFLDKKIDPKKIDVYWYGSDALDFLSRLYDQAVIYLPRKRDLYIDWCVFVPGLSGSGTHGEELVFKWNKTRRDAKAPFKVRASDSGYDLTVLEKTKTIGLVEFYETGIKIQPAVGWYFDVVPRSSIFKTGYIQANSVGIIDRSYRGTIIIPLIKIDKNFPDLELPCRIAQLIPRPIIHARFTETENISDTDRGERGFGSTGRSSF